MTEAECLRKYRKVIGKWGLLSIEHFEFDFDHPSKYSCVYYTPENPEPDTSSKHVLSIGFGTKKIEDDMFFHCEDGPARLVFRPDGSIATEEFWINGVMHREDGPAEIEYYPDGKLCSETYYINGDMHRDGEPARIEYSEDDVDYETKKQLINKQEYYQHGKRHRIGGPAVIVGSWKDVRHEYWVDDRKHREDGPSTVYLEGDKEKTKWREYHLDGVRVDKRTVLFPHRLTVAHIEKEWNAESRRVMIERFGWPKFLEAKKADVVDVSENAIENTIETLFMCQTNKHSRRLPVLLCACPSTARVYGIQLPRQIKNCQGARKWLMGNRMRNAKLIGAS